MEDEPVDETKDYSENRNPGKKTIGRRGAIASIGGALVGATAGSRISRSYQTSSIGQEITLSEGQEFSFTHQDGRGQTDYTVEVLQILDDDAVRMEYTVEGENINDTGTFTADKRGETLNEQAEIYLTRDAQVSEEGPGEATFRLEYQQIDTMLDAVDPRNYL